MYFQVAGCIGVKMPELNNTILKNSANLKAYYRLESGALTTDSSAGGYTLTNNNTVGDGTGKFGGCADFGTSNSNKYFSITSDIGISATADCSFAFWTKLPSLPSSGNRYSFFGKDITGATGSRYNLSYYNNSGTYQLLGNRSRGASGTDTATYAVTLATNTWYHIVVTYSANTLKVYLNSSFVSSVSSTGTGSVGEATALYLGAWNVGGITQYINGNIDDFSIFTSALTADQVKELYEGRYIGELPKDTGCQGLWHFNGNITDFSGNNYHLTNTSTTDIAGKFGNGRDFESSSSTYLDVTAANCNITTTQTWSLWLKLESFSADQFPIGIRNSGGGNNRGLNLINSSQKMRFDFDGLTGGSVTHDTTLSTGTWYHIVAIYDSTVPEIRLWLNGVKKTGSVSGSMSAITGKFVIGRNGDMNQYYFDGIMDEVGVYNRAWSDKEVKNYYANARGKY